MSLPSKDTDPVGHYAYKLGEAEQEIKQVRAALKELERVTDILLRAAGEGGAVKAYRAIDLLPRKYVYEAREACAKARALIPPTT